MHGKGSETGTVTDEQGNAFLRHGLVAEHWEERIAGIVPQADCLGDGQWPARTITDTSASLYVESVFSRAHGLVLYHVYLDTALPWE